MKRFVRSAAIALALAATALTVEAKADSAESAPPPPSEHATPLTLRSSKPLELAQEPAHLSTGWKIVALLALVGGTLVYLRRRAPRRGDATGDLLIVRRAAVGIRSELLVVNVEGQRLLIGVTPHTIQSLAILDSEEPASNGVSATAPTMLGERFAAMLDSARRNDAGATKTPPSGRPTRQTDPTRPTERIHDDGEHLADQARGLLALRRGS